MHGPGASDSMNLPTFHGRLFLAVLVLAGAVLLWLLDLPVWYFLVSLVAVILGSATYWYRRSSRDLFHPLVFPTMYISYVLFSPWVYMTVTEQPIGIIDPASVHGPAIWVMMFTVLGWFLGSLTFLEVGVTERPNHVRYQTENTSNLFVHIGRILLVLLVVGRLTQIRLFAGKVYGANQFQYDVASQLATAVLGLFIVATLLVIIGNLGRERKPLGRYDWCLFLVIAGLGLVFLGSRADVVAPTIIVLWAYGKKHRLRPGAVLAVMACAVQLFVYVGDNRGVGSPVVHEPLLARSLLDTSSPYMITDNLTRSVPALTPYLGGRTYAVSLEMMLPGSISRLLVSEAPQTATIVYRQIEGQTDPNASVGFSLPSEAYLNFGMSGALTVGLLVGSVFGMAYRRSTSRRRGSAGDYFYPILAAAVPYGLRSDALGQMKMALYPLLILTVISLIVRRRTSPTPPADMTSYVLGVASVRR